MRPIRFGIVGGGWRSLFYLRIAREIPERFEVGGVVVRDSAKGDMLEATWGVKTYRTLDDLLRVSGLDFVVVSVPWPVTPQVLFTLADRSIPALAETPPAPDLPNLTALNELIRRRVRVQVAEQYHLQPLLAAQLAVVQSRKLGTVTQAQVSVAHGYHGISLIRKFLGIAFEPVTITAQRIISPLIAGPDRGGPPTHEHTTSSQQVIAHLDFGDKLGIYDFTDDQYFSWIRSSRLLIRGDRGEIINSRVRYLADFHTPITIDLMRQDAGEEGNLEGYYHKGILSGGEWVYQNPFAPARLSDDEIAIATCLSKMQIYVEGGPDFYNLAEAAQDHYLNIMIERALVSDSTVKTTLQTWAE